MLKAFAPLLSGHYERKMKIHSLKGRRKCWLLDANIKYGWSGKLSNLFHSRLLKSAAKPFKIRFPFTCSGLFVYLGANLIPVGG